MPLAPDCSGKLDRLLRRCGVQLKPATRKPSRPLNTSAFMRSDPHGGSFSRSGDWMLCCFLLTWSPVLTAVLGLGLIDAAGQILMESLAANRRIT